ncbi:DUF2510 domain-containing protein [Streptomyces sp. MNU89]|uniref:DUF2510 domain-containing protein n=1 Tax=Streptomyces sp. MNU89 TaxID=2560025 RepID=UPI001E5C33E7|nr:DUF2510 domain-containing protein [Streptomyces sp. MNU89]MCC9741249.1 DUF2510 domain-containing protein [Streptomyces sp. MNU89]
MSAPTSGSADGGPAPGYYPDPSIPGYIRYWNGASWVPGTSRPAPGEGTRCPPRRREPPPTVRGGPAAPAASPSSPRRPPRPRPVAATPCPPRTAPARCTSTRSPGPPPRERRGGRTGRGTREESAPVPRRSRGRGPVRAR